MAQITQLQVNALPGAYRGVVTPTTWGFKRATPKSAILMKTKRMTPKTTPMKSE